MVNTSSHQAPEDPFERSQPGDFRGNLIANEEWVERQEEALGAKLTTPVRRAIAVVMNRVDFTPLTALEKVKEEYFEGAEDESDAKIIEDISVNLREQIGGADVIDIRGARKLKEYEVFLKSVSASLHSALFGSSEQPDEKKFKAASRIKNIFYQLEYEINETGLISSDPKALQEEIDGYIEECGFDKNVFSDSVEKYVSLLAPNV